MKSHPSYLNSFLPAEIVFRSYVRILAATQVSFFSSLKERIQKAEVFDWVDTRESSHLHEQGEDADPYDPPFENFFVSVGNVILKLTKEEDPGSFFRVLGFLFWEDSPHVYDASFLLLHQNGNVLIASVEDLDLWGIVNSFFKSYQTCAMGHCSTGRLKFPMPSADSSKKKVYRIVRKVIVLAAKGKTNEVVSGRAVDWSHRFTVRGHWRVIEGGKGKNRDGDRCVEGFTWVKAHEKGPEGAPLIPKIRVVRDESLEGSV